MDINMIGKKQHKTTLQDVIANGLGISWLYEFLQISGIAYIWAVRS